MRAVEALLDASPLRREVVERTDLLVVRELTGGIYFGAKTRDADSASDLCVYTTGEIERIARVAFGAARSKVTSVDKANVLETSRLWREVVRRVHSEEFPQVELEHALVDSTAMKLITAPRHFDVILTENMFGDILSDEASVLTGSLGLLPSASLGDRTDAPRASSSPSTAPRRTSRGRGSPTRWPCSCPPRCMLRHGLGRQAEAAAVESAVDRALEAGLRTRDLGGTASTAEATQAVLAHLD